LPKPSRRKLTVKEVWRNIVKKNERQGATRWDVLVCGHSVPANDNTYRKARSCPDCREKVQEYVDARARSDAAAAPAEVAPLVGTDAPAARRKRRAG
jgi:hypothetical protein